MLHNRSRPRAVLDCKLLLQKVVSVLHLGCFALRCPLSGGCFAERQRRLKALTIAALREITDFTPELQDSDDYLIQKRNYETKAYMYVHVSL